MKSKVKYQKVIFVRINWFQEKKFETTTFYFSFPNLYLVTKFKRLQCLSFWTFLSSIIVKYRYLMNNDNWQNKYRFSSSCIVTYR